MMTPGELKQLNEKLLKEIQGENFSVLFGLFSCCFLIKKIKKHNKKTTTKKVTALQFSVLTEISVYYVSMLNKKLLGAFIM